MNKPFLLHWMVRSNFRAKQKANQKLCIGRYSHPLLLLLFLSTVNRETSSTGITPTLLPKLLNGQSEQQRKNVKGNYEKCMNMWISVFTWQVGVD